MRVQVDLLDRVESTESVLAEEQFQIIPPRMDEFVCTSCFLVHHHSQLRGQPDELICTDCLSDRRTR